VHQQFPVLAYIFHSSITNDGHWQLQMESGSGSVLDPIGPIALHGYEFRSAARIRTGGANSIITAVIASGVSAEGMILWPRQTSKLVVMLLDDQASCRSAQLAIP